jgi:hypothetical protein
MSSQAKPLDTLNDIRNMMEKSSRFISLSGWSGIAAGICGLAGLYLANRTIASYSAVGINASIESLQPMLIKIAAAVFVAAFVLAFLFTYLRSKREGTPVWSSTSKRLLWNTMLPMLVGGMVILKLLNMHNYTLVSPAMLIFYGLALLNGSKYTLGEIRYLAYLEIALGLINLWYPSQWMLFWAIGFGGLHIVYGAMMWWKYERQ